MNRNGGPTSPEYATCTLIASICTVRVIQVSTDAPETSTPTLPARVSRLDTVNRVRREMVRVYWSMKHGEIQSGVGSKMIFALSIIQRAIEFETTEDRLTRIEEALQSPALANRAAPRMTYDG